MWLRSSFKRREKFLALLLLINLYLSIVEQRETLREVYLVALERSSLSKVLIYIYMCVLQRLLVNTKGSVLTTSLSEQVILQLQ